MIEEARIDEKGRINIGQETRRRYGSTFFVVKLSDEILLIPKPKDPVAELRKWGKELETGKLTSGDIEVLAEEEAYKQIEERNSRRNKGR